jgi:hypothetical protein
VQGNLHEADKSDHLRVYCFVCLRPCFTANVMRACSKGPEVQGLCDFRGELTKTGTAAIDHDPGKGCDHICMRSLEQTMMMK